MKPIERHDAAMRSNHWALALLFFGAAFSGLSFFHPSLFFLANLFGGGPWARILHPFIGIAVVLVFAVMYARVAKDNWLNDADREWLKMQGAVMRGEHPPNLPPVGKYNGAQKRLFWLMTACVAILLATGIAFWQPWFAPLLPINLVRLAALLHAVAALAIVIGVIVHVYAAIWIKGSVRAMTRGFVSEAWARQHHGEWHRELTQGK